MIDINKYYQIDAKLIEHRITPNTKAILYVDLYGQCANVSELRRIASKHQLFLIADSAQSFGSHINGTTVGTHADLTCISFNPVKNLGGMGDSGCILGANALISRAKQIRDHGRTSKYTSDVVGTNARIDNLQAAIILAKLPYLKSWIEQRREICARYNQSLADIVETPKTPDDNYHTYHIYCIATDNRNGLQDYLRSKSIQTNIHYPIPCHLQPAYSNFKISLPKTEIAATRILSLPCYHSLTIDHQDYIIDKIKKWKSRQ